MAIDLSALSGITADSRAVRPGFAFVAIKGLAQDGNQYIKEAVSSGAVVIVSSQLQPVDWDDTVAYYQVDEPRKVLAEWAVQFYQLGYPALKAMNIVAVTGTNGKSSVVSFCEQLWAAMGVRGASLGTINAGLTSLGPVELQERMVVLSQQGVTHLALEASSHGLDQYRLDGLKVGAAAFTNLTRDHMDYHGDEAAYSKAKLGLFNRLVGASGVSVINADSASYKDVAAVSLAPVVSYGFAGEDLKIKSLTPVFDGCHVELELFGRSYSLDIPLIGAFQISNLLCAAGLVLGDENPSGDQIDAVVESFKTIQGVKGRLQSVSGHPAQAGIYIDYAHTPDALLNVLNAIKPHAKGRILCLFGCGGDRDKGKRPLMGEVAANHSDIVIITDDNPRSENSVDIRSEILAPIRSIRHNDHIFEIGDRSAAINFSVQQLKQGDVLIIAGKGHEVGQILASKTIPFDDYEEAVKAINAL